MGIIVWILLGVLAGMLIKFLMPGEDLGGIVIMIALGVAGAVVCGFISTLFGVGDITGFDLRNQSMALGGAIALLFGYRCLKLKGQV